MDATSRHIIDEALEEICAGLDSDGRFGKQELKSEDVEALYELGHSFYKGSDFTQAVLIFRRLVQFAPLSLDYWHAFAAALQCAKQYDEALIGWSMCCLMDEENPLYHYHAGECLISNDQREEAIKALEIARSKMTQEHEALQGRIALLLNKGESDE